MNRRGRLIVHLSLVFGGLGSVGCSAKPVLIETPKETHNINYVVVAYMTAEARLGHPPKNEEELKPFLKDFGNPDEVLTSPNDGEKFVVLYGTRATAGLRIIAYEKKGKDGKRYVANPQVRIWPVTEEQFGQLRLPAGNKGGADK
jgi:hypothetical protein